MSDRLNVIYLLPESGGRLPDGSRVLLQEIAKSCFVSLRKWLRFRCEDLVARADLNGKAGKIASWALAGSLVLSLDQPVKECRDSRGIKPHLRRTRKH